MEGSSNVQGEDQKKLDVVANDLFINMLRSSYKVAMMVSEENDTVISGEAIISDAHSPQSAQAHFIHYFSYRSIFISDILYGNTDTLQLTCIHSPRTICVCVTDEVRDLLISDLTDSYSFFN